MVTAPASSAEVVFAKSLSLLDVVVTVPDVGKVNVVSPEVENVKLFAPMFKALESVPASVNELLAVSVLPSAMVRVEPEAGAVKATLLTDVAVATPSTGVTRVGVVARTTEPEPVVADVP